MYRVGEIKAALRATAAGAAILCTSGLAVAGGFEIREQSSYFQGMSFAGAAAGGSNLSSIFWNPAASSYVGYGLVTDTSFSLINANSQIDAAPTIGSCAAHACSVDSGGASLVPASYMAYRLDSRTVFALAINSQFGSSTKPDDPNWQGMFHSRGAKLFSVNANPSVSYEVAPGVAIGIGMQVQFLDLQHLRSALPIAGFPSATLEGDGIGLGVTAGVNWRPTPGTSIGLGYRSSIRHNIDGSFSGSGIGSTPVSTTIDTPDKVTFSFSQALSPSMRVLGTVDWTQWSRLGVIPIVPTTPVGNLKLDFQWHDGWLFALGGEWDVNRALTLRAGAAYEISPVQDPTERLVQIPDADRIWVSFGGTYRINDATALNFGYSHVFVEDASLQRATATGAAPILFADTSASVDIVSVGLTMKWGGPPPGGK